MTKRAVPLGHSWPLSFSRIFPAATNRKRKLLGFGTISRNSPGASHQRVILKWSHSSIRSPLGWTKAGSWSSQRIEAKASFTCSVRGLPESSFRSQSYTR